MFAIPCSSSASVQFSMFDKLPSFSIFAFEISCSGLSMSCKMNAISFLFLRQSKTAYFARTQPTILHLRGITETCITEQLRKKERCQALKRAQLPLLVLNFQFLIGQSTNLVLSSTRAKPLEHGHLQVSKAYQKWQQVLVKLLPL